MARRADQRARAAGVRAGSKAKGRAAAPSALEIAHGMEVPLDEAEDLADAVNLLVWALETADGRDAVRPMHAVVETMQARLAFLQKSMRLLVAACAAAGAPPP